MDPADFDLMFERFAQSAFRLETRDTYNVATERESFLAFTSTGAAPQRSAEDDPWLTLVSNQTGRGKTILRVRLFTTPPTDYTRFEFTRYADNIAAGEDIRVADRTSLPDSASEWGDQDFWLFDQETVVVMHYDKTGAFIQPELENDVQNYLDKAQRALDASLPFGAHHKSFAPEQA
jgi:hypothetical protein